MSTQQLLETGKAVTLFHSRVNEHRGWIVERKPTDTGAQTFVIGAGGLKPTGASYRAVSDDLRFFDVDECDAAEAIASAFHDDIDAEAVAAKVAEAEAKRAAELEARDKAQQERLAARELFEADAAERMPAWAKAVIVGQLEVSDCDVMTDYFGSHTTKTVLLAWSKHTRDLFSEMRKAAANFEGTADLASNPFTVQPVFVVADGAPSPVWGQGYVYNGSVCSSFEHDPDFARPDEFASEAEARAWCDAHPLPDVKSENGAPLAVRWHIAEVDLEHREKYSMGGGYYLGRSRYSGWKVSKVRIADVSGIPSGEWHIPSETKRTRKPATRTAGAGGVEVQKHHHTKRGFDFWLVVDSERVERDEFDRRRDECKARGGWYSRAWAGTPGGFAFKSEDSAESFAIWVRGTGGDDTPPDGGPDDPRPDRFRAMADQMQADIDHKLGGRRTNTPKQQYQAACARLDGMHLIRAQAALRAMAETIDAGDRLPACLADVRTKKRVLELTRHRLDTSNRGYYDAPIDTGEIADTCDAARALRELAGNVDAHARQADELQRMLDSVKGAKIPGYFPTPPAVVSRLIELAELTRGDMVLEPSAGSGAIVSALADAGWNAHYFEINPTLRAILTARGQGFERGSDFMAADDPAPIFGAVLMNPPFERGQDMEHITRAWAWLRPGGRLVAVCSPAWTFHDSALARTFRDWIGQEAVNLQTIELPAGTFAESGTGVAAMVLAFNKRNTETT